MARNKLRARFILADPNRLDQVFAVYPRTVDPERLESVVAQLRALRGVEAGVAVTTMDAARTPVTVIICRMDATSGQRALALFRKLTDPVLPVAIREFHLELLICACGYLSSRQRWSFVNRFGPEDEEAFKLRLFAGLQKLKLADLFSRQPTAPYQPVADGVERMLAGLKARATAIYIEPGPDPRPCSHRH